MRSVWFLIMLIVALSTGFIGGCDSSERLYVDQDEVVDETQLQEQIKEEPRHVFNFGFDLRNSIKEDVRQYAPFLKYLEHKTGYRFEIRFTPESSNIEDDLGKGIVQFAAIGAGTYLAAHQRYGVIPLVRGLNAKGKAEYQSAIIVRPDSSIRSLSELKGKSFAFGNFTSSQGHLIPRVILAQHGILLKDFSHYTWTGSHYNCASAVADGEFDAGGIQDTMAFSLAQEGRVKILLLSDFYPSSGIAVNRDVDLQVQNKVKQALLDFEPNGRHAGGLHNWEKTEMANGFIEASFQDYDEMKVWAEKFGFLPRKER